MRRLLLQLICFVITTQMATAQGYWPPGGSGTSGVNFGGNGKDGAISISGSPSDNQKVWYATTFTVAGSGTETCTDCLINATSTVSFPNLSTFRSFQGYAPATGQSQASSDGYPGFGPGGGLGGNTGVLTANPYGAGGGASCIANGGDGGGAGQSANHGRNVGVASEIRLGSGGGSGATGVGGTSGAGGVGGDSLRIFAVGAITTTNGTNVAFNAGQGGSSSTLAGGAGGGGGGSVWLYSQTSITLGNNGTTISCSGGSGKDGVGTNAGGGGAGGGGFVFLMSPVNTGTASVGSGSGGAAGSGGVAGSSGTAGSVTSYAQTPTLPTLTFCNDARGVLAQTRLERDRHTLAHKSIERIDFTAHEGTTWLAAWYAKPGQFDNVCYAITNGGTFDDVRDMCAINIEGSINDIRKSREVMEGYRSPSPDHTCADFLELQPAS